MNRILTIILMLIVTLSCFCKDFGDVFCDSTLRLDLSITKRGESFSVCLDSVAQWKGWYGRKVNLTKEQYPEEMQVSVISIATGDTLYVDSKCPEAFGEPEMISPLNVTMFAPKPREPFKVSVSVNATEATGRRELQSVSRHFYDYDMEALTDGNSEPKNEYMTIRKAANPNQCINLAIISEGYKTDEMESFIRKAEQLDSTLFCQPGFKENAHHFNVVAVLLPSVESGVTVPSAGLIVNSALASHFDSYGLERLVTVPDTRLIWDAIEGIPASKVLILTNTSKYGGSGSYNEYAIASANLDIFAEIIIHELGHSFGWLGDEYESDYTVQYTADVEPLEPNITTLHDFSKKWQNLIDAGVASLYEGAGYQKEGVWRGCEHCIMRALEDHYFCPVCAQALGHTVQYLTVESD